MKSLITFLIGIVDFIFSKTIPKFFLFAGLYFAVLEFTPALIGLIGGQSLISNIQTLFNNIPSGALYFLSLFKVATGLKIVLSAYIVRFIIRRIPLIG